MKKIYLLIVLAITTKLSFGQNISDIKREGNSLYVYNEKGDYISQKSLQSDDKVRNVSGNNIIIKSGNTIYTYDKKFDYISQRSDY